MSNSRKSVVGVKWLQRAGSVGVSIAFILSMGPGIAHAAASSTYSTPGTYTFIVPSFSTLTVQVWGAGGGGGEDNGSNGSGGGQSKFGTVVGNGGAGGNANATGGSGGSASGGTTNQSGTSGETATASFGGAGGAGANGGAGGARITSRNTGLPGTVPGGAGSGSFGFSGSTRAGGGGGGAYATRSYTSAQLTPGSTTTVAVGSSGAGGNGGTAFPGGNGSNGKVVITWLAPLPSAPANPTPQNGATSTNTSLTLSWSASTPTSTPTTYAVYLGTSPSIATSSLKSIQSGTTYNPGALLNNTTYYWRIDAANEAGTTTGAVWSFTTQAAATPPPQASNPSPQDTAVGQPLAPPLSWTGSLGSTYDVYVGTTSTLDVTAYRGTVATSTFSLSPLLASTTYYWRVDAANAFGTTTGTMWSFTTSIPTPPVAASNPIPASGTLDKPAALTLTWTGGISATSFDVYFGTDPSLASSYLGTQSGTSTAVSGLIASTTYYWRIDSGNSVGTTTGAVWNFSTVKPVLLDAAVPLFPRNTISGMPVSVTLKWVGSTTTTLYDLYVGTSPSLGQGDFQGTLATTTKYFTNLSYSTTYYWRIDAANSFGTTTGATWSFTTSDPVPPAQAANGLPVTGSLGVPTSALLSWTPDSNATAYDVYLGTSPSLGTSTYMGSHTTPSYSPSSLTTNTTYYWRIDTANSFGTTTGTTWIFTTTGATTTFQTTTTSNVAYGADPAQILDVCAPVTSQTNLSAIIFIHGGGWTQGDKSNTSAPCTQFAKNGFLGVNINYRLFSTSTDPTNSYPAQAADAQLAVRWLRAHAGDYHIDPSRICAFGRSSGAHIALLLGTHSSIIPSDMAAQYPGISPAVSCVVDEYGPSDLYTLIDTADRPDVWYGMGNYATKGYAGLVEASPVYSVDANTTPMIIVQGDMDTTIVPQHSIEMREALQSLAIPWQYIEFANGSHGLPELTLLQRAALLASEGQFISSKIGGI